MKTIQYAAVFFFLVRSCLLAGAADVGGTIPGSGPGERVALQLSWRHKFQFAGYYMAQEKGYYREAGFDVELREWRGGIDSVRSVVLGRADFGVAQGSLNGAPIIVLASILQRSPAVVVALEGSGIRTPADLAGRRVMNGPDSLAEGYWSMLAANGVSPAQVTIVPHDGTLDALFDGRADACMGYATDEPWHLRKRGVRCVVLHPEDYGVEYPAEMLFTSSRMAREKPGRVQAFRDASLRGWTYAMNHVDEAIDLILRDYAPGGDRAELEFEAATLAKLMMLDLVEIGYVHPGRWKRMMQAQGTLPGDPTGPMTEAEIEAMLFDDSAAHPARRWVRIALGWLVAALSALVLLAAASLSLRDAVRRKTRELREANERLVGEKANLEETGRLLRLERDFNASALLAATLQDCLERLVELVLQIPEVDCSGVYLRNEKTGAFEMSACRGLSEAFTLRWRSYREDLPDYANFRQGRTVTYTAADVPVAFGEAMRSEGLRCVLIMPIAVGSEVVAALHVGSRQVDAVPITMQTALESLSVRLSDVLARFDALRRLRESESMFRRVAEGVFDAITLVDDAGRYLFVNDRAKQVFGYSEAELLGFPFSRLLPEEETARGLRRFQTRLEGGVVPATYTVALRKKEGERFPAEISVKETQWRGHRAFVCAIRDLTERRRLEAQVLQIDEWERSRIGQYLHDSVGQDLVGLACMLKALENSLARADAAHADLAARARAVCLSAHTDLRNVVRAVLPLGADQSLGTALEGLAATLRERSGVAFDVQNELASEAIDPQRATQLRFIAQEAAVNAIRHGSARSITIALVRKGESGVLRIDDDGSGFDAGAVSSGSGLRIMRYRANVLGGRLVVERRATGGTTVCCEFPL